MFNFLVLSWALTLGYVPEQANFVDTNHVAIDQSRLATVATVDFGVTAWGVLHVYSEIETFQYLCKDLQGFNPYRANYTFGTDFYINKNLTLGLVHECDHPIVSGTNMTTEYKYASNETKIFIRIGSEKQ
jgi:hypothetical protein